MTFPPTALRSDIRRSLSLSRKLTLSRQPCRQQNHQLANLAKVEESSIASHPLLPSVTIAMVRVAGAGVAGAVESVFQNRSLPVLELRPHGRLRALIIRRETNAVSSTAGACQTHAAECRSVYERESERE